MHSTLDDAMTARVIDGNDDRSEVTVDITAAPWANGPVGVLQGGLATQLLVEAARAAEGVTAPLTFVEANLRAPTPLATGAVATVTRTAAGRYDVAARDRSGAALIDGTVELRGHDPGPVPADVMELATVDVGDPWAQDYFPTCVVCGPSNARGLGMLPTVLEGDRAVAKLLPSDVFTGHDHVPEMWLAPMLDCPAVWAAWKPIVATTLHGKPGAGGLLARMRVTPVQPAGVHDLLRAVAVTDDIDGRKISSRTALVDEEGRLFATASLLTIIVGELPALAG